MNILYDMYDCILYDIKNVVSKRSLFYLIMCSGSLNAVIIAY